MRTAVIWALRVFQIGCLITVCVGVCAMLTGCGALSEMARSTAEFLQANPEAVPPGGPVDGMDWGDITLWALGLLGGGKAGEKLIKRNIAAGPGEVI